MLYTRHSQSLNRTLRLGLLSAAALMTSAQFASVASAAEISIDFEGTNAGSGGYLMNETSSIKAGAPGAATAGTNWNDCWATTTAGYNNYYWDQQTTLKVQSPGPAGNSYTQGTISYQGTSGRTYLHDDGGMTQNSLSVAMQYDFDNRGPTTGGAGTQDATLFSDALGTSVGSNYYKTGGFIALQSIPYASYSVYVYFESASTGNGAAIGDGSTTYYVSNNTATGGTFNGYVHVTNTDGVDADGTGNYVVFTGETASNLTISMTPNATSSMDFAGIQIVQTTPTPEPASLCIFGVGAAALLRRRRRH